MLWQEGARTQGQGGLPSSSLEDGYKAPVATGPYGVERRKTTAADVSLKLN